MASRLPRLVPTGFAGAVSRGLFGDALRRRSAEAGLDLRVLQQVARSPLLAFTAATAAAACRHAGAYAPTRAEVMEVLRG